MVQNHNNFKTQLGINIKTDILTKELIEDGYKFTQQLIPEFFVKTIRTYTGK